MCTCICECGSMGFCVRAFQCETEMNRRCSSHTVLTGSPGTIALTDPSDWVHMRIKTLSLPLSKFFSFPFSSLSCSPLCRSLSLLLRFLPLLILLFMSFCCLHSPFPSTFLFLFSSQLWAFFLCFQCREVLGLHCWSDHVPKTSVSLHWVHLSSGSPLLHFCALAQWSWTGNFEVGVLHSAVFKSQTLVIPNVIWEFI